MRVLIAEDTESVRFALRLAVEHLGHEVIGMAGDGRDALSMYQRTHPDVVLMDVRMPIMDGLTCTALLAQQIPPARVVIVTGGRTNETEARLAGAQAFVEKPFDLKHLDQVIVAVGQRAAA
jgi:two-component system chemotaxis response regulator CheY